MSIKEDLERVLIPNYDSFHNLTLPTVTLKKINFESAINVVAAIKTVRIKSNRKECFEITKLQIDKVIYKEWRNAIRSAIRKKKKSYFEEKLKSKTANAKNLWETLKQLGLPYKKSLSSDIWLKKKQGLAFDPLAIPKVFQKLLSNLANSLEKNYSRN